MKYSNCHHCCTAAEHDEGMLQGQHVGPLIDTMSRMHLAALPLPPCSVACVAPSRKWARSSQPTTPTSMPPAALVAHSRPQALPALARRPRQLSKEVVAVVPVAVVLAVPLLCWRYWKRRCGTGGWKTVDKVFSASAFVSGLTTAKWPAGRFTSDNAMQPISK